MEPRISIITLGVESLERSLAFYRDGLGFPTTWTAEKGVIFFQTQGTRLALYPYKLLATDVGPGFAGPRSKFAGMTLAHNVDTRADVDATLKRAAAAGGKIEHAGEPVEWGGYRGYFSDPDGYLWEIACEAFPFNADRTLKIP